MLGHVCQALPILTQVVAPEVVANAETVDELVAKQEKEMEKQKIAEARVLTKYQKKKAE